MARFSAMFLPERSGFGLNELLGAPLHKTTLAVPSTQEFHPYLPKRFHKIRLS